MTKRSSDRVTLSGEVVVPECMRGEVDPGEYAKDHLVVARNYLRRKAINDGYTAQCLRTAAEFLGSVKVQVDNPIAGRWRCTSCGAAMSADAIYVAPDASWRWNGENWEHKCPGADPQCGHFQAVREEG